MRRRLYVTEIIVALRLAALCEWWASSAAMRLKERANKISQG
jgi:hypothetical protein